MSDLSGNELGAQSKSNPWSPPMIVSKLLLLLLLLWLLLLLFANVNSLLFLSVCARK